MAESPSDVSSLWTDDMVGFLLGCSFSWEDELAQRLPPRAVEEGRGRAHVRARAERRRRRGDFNRGRLVVSMRPYRPDQIARVAEITARYPARPRRREPPGTSTCELGINDLSAPDFGDAVTIKPREVPRLLGVRRDAAGGARRGGAAARGDPRAGPHARADVREAALEERAPEEARRRA